MNRQSSEGVRDEHGNGGVDQGGSETYMTDEVRRPNHLHAFVALAILFHELDLNAGEPDLTKLTMWVDGELKKLRHGVPQEAIMHGAKLNTTQTKRVIEFLKGQGFIEVNKPEKQFDIRITVRGAEHYVRNRRSYLEIFSNELNTLFRYSPPPWEVSRGPPGEQG